jgi:hypothetical protein
MVSDTRLVKAFPSMVNTVTSKYFAKCQQMQWTPPGRGRSTGSCDHSLSDVPQCGSQQRAKLAAQRLGPRPLLRMLSRMTFAKGVFVCLAATQLAYAAVAGEGPRFDFAQLDQVVRLASPAISPDGRTVAVIVSRTDFIENHTNDSLVLVDVATGSQRIVTAVDANSPAWSPDGSRLAWLSSGRICVAPSETPDTKPIPVTGANKASAAVQSFAWSADGKSIAFLAVKTPVERQGEDRFDRSFEVVNHDQSSRGISAGDGPIRLWLTASDKDTSKPLTSDDESVQISTI